MRRSAAKRALCLALLALAACDGARTWSGHGVVHEVSAADGQVLIEHDDIPGLMPAMTMSFAIRDPALLGKLAPGDVIDFEVTSQDGSLSITQAKVVGQVPAEDGWIRMGNGLVKSDPAPPFSLTDTRGETVSLAGLAGQVLLVDFIFTRCPGPCPALTSTHVVGAAGATAGAARAHPLRLHHPGSPARYAGRSRAPTPGPGAPISRTGRSSPVLRTRWRPW